MVLIFMSGAIIFLGALLVEGFLGESSFHLFLQLISNFVKFILALLLPALLLLAQQ